MNDIPHLIQTHKRLIESEAAKYARFIPITYVTIEAYKLARQAAEKFNPDAGVKFSTYLTNALQKLSRLSTQYGNIVRVPENKQFRINRLNQFEQALTEELGRPPTVAELSDTSGMSIGHVNSLLGTRKKEVNMSNLAYTPVFFEGSSDEWVHFVYHDLTDKDKLIFEYRTGFGGKPILDNGAIAKKLGMSPSTVSQRIKMITNKIAEGLNE
jgi:DNA-directed RNA polymerase sigma subunit (sigma70/sigma32)